MWSSIFRPWTRASVALAACAVIGIGGCGGGSPVKIEFGADPSVIEYGQTSSLNWNVTPAGGYTVQGVNIEPAVGIVDATGEQDVSPNQTTDYTLTALVSDSKGNQIQRQSKVTLLVQQGTAWNWQRSDVFRDFNNVQLLSPWAADQHFGVDVTGNTHPPEDGWRLYIKRLTCSDYIEGCDNASLPQYEDRRNFPYFALYNVYTGVMRIFVYINKPNFTGSKQLVVTTSILESGSLSDFGLSLQESDFSLPVDQKDAQQNVQVSVIQSFVNKWAVLERSFSFDPAVPPADLSLNLYFEERQIQDVQLSGEFQFTLTSQQRAGGKDLLSALMKAPGTVKKHKKDVVNTGNDIKDVAADLAASADLRLPDGFIDRADKFGDFLIDNAGSFGAIAGFVGGLDFLSGFSNLLGKSSSVQYGSGTITLSGSITNQYPQNQISIGLHHSHQLEAGDTQVSSLDATEVGSLGLFSLSRTPRMWVQPRCGSSAVQSLDVSCPVSSKVVVRDPTGDNTSYETELNYTPIHLDWRFESDFAEMVEINPSSEMVLKSIRVAPIIGVPVVRHTLYSIDEEGRLETNIQRDVWTAAPSSFDIKIVNEPRLTPYRTYPVSATYIGQQLWDVNVLGPVNLSFSRGRQTIRYVNEDRQYEGLRAGGDEYYFGHYKVYMMFVHASEVDSENPKVFAEFIQTYKADILVGKPN